MSERIIEATIEKLIPGGEGLARVDGKTHFIPGGLPGEKVRAAVIEDKKNWARCGSAEVLEASEKRVEAFCPLYGICGGCSWQHMAYETQVESKLGFASEALVRQAGLNAETVPEITAFPSPPKGYRSRIRPLILPSGAAAFRELKSNKPVPIEECPVVTPGLARFLASPPKALKPDSEPVVFGDDEHFRVEGIHKKAEATVAGKTFRFPPGAFFQSNLKILDSLIEFSIGGDSTGGNVALDLYGGVGLFGAFLADRYETVIGVDRDKRTKGPWLSHVGEKGQFRANSLEKWIRTSKDPRPDFVVVDPPRGGLDARVRQGLMKLDPPEISYVSCDPVTQARDIKAFMAGGYRIESYGLFDLYPQTPHAEVVARLVKG